MRNVLLPHFRAIPVYSGLFPYKNHLFRDFGGLVHLWNEDLGNTWIPPSYCGALHHPHMRVLTLMIEDALQLFVQS